MVNEWGEPDQLKVSEIEEAELTDDDVLIDVKAAGCNFLDVLCVQGKYQIKPAFPFVLGSESSGVVKRVGSNVTKFKEGDRVISFSGLGHYTEKLVCNQDMVSHSPKGMPFAEGAAFGIAYITTYMGLVLRGNLKANEVLLVNAAAGGVGTAAVQIGRAIGATVIGTVGSAAKMEIAKRAGCHHVIDLSKQPLINSVMELTDNRGADVVYDPVGGDVFDQSLRCTAWNGRVLVVGFASGRIPTVKANYTLLKSISIVGVNMGGSVFGSMKSLTDSLSGVTEMYEKGQLKPLIYPKIFKLSEVPEALKLLASRESYGKVVVAVDETIDIKAKL